MIYLISRGQYSDYGVVAVVEGPEESNPLKEAFELANLEHQAAWVAFYEKQRMLREQFESINGVQTSDSRSFSGWHKAFLKFIQEHHLSRPVPKDIKDILPEGFKVVPFNEIHMDA